MLPLSARPDHDNILQNVPREIKDAAGYRELLDCSISYGEEAIRKFRAIRDRNNFKGGE